MTVPDFQSFMLPLLKFTVDKEEHWQSEAADALARHFDIMDADRKRCSLAEDKQGLIIVSHGQ